MPKKSAALINKPIKVRFKPIKNPIRVRFRDKDEKIKDQNF